MSWPHVHLVLNHVPVLGTVFGAILLICGLWRRNESLQRAALWTFVSAALVAIPVYLTGEPAEEAIEHLAGTGESAIEAHEEAALLSLIAIELLGLVAVVSLLVARWAKGGARAALVIGFVTVSIMTWTANLGGRIRRPELRGAATTEQRGEPEEHGEGSR